MKVSVRWGCNPKARQMRLTVVWLSPLRWAMDRVLQCVASLGVDSSVSVITRSTSSSVTARGRPLYLIFPRWDAPNKAAVLGIMNSSPFDWLARRYVELHLNFYVLNSLTFPPPDNTPWERIGKLAGRLSCVDDRFAEFAAEASVECGNLTPAQRNDMRAEIDAQVAHAYGLTADELRFIFTDFTQNAVPQMYRDQVLEKFEGL